MPPSFKEAGGAYCFWVVQWFFVWSPLGSYLRLSKIGTCYSSAF